MASSSAESPPVDIARQGLTLLPVVTPAEGATKYDIDYVFLHGLNGHPENTWKHPAGFYWPDQIRRDVPGSRVMIHGYNADFEMALVENKTTIKAIAQTLISRLIDLREDDQDRRPIVFLAHSLGGLVVKRALVQIQIERNSGLDTGRIRDQNGIYDSIAGLVFLGTPHAGSDIPKKTRVRVLKAVATAAFIKAPKKLMDALAAYSDELEELSDSFKNTTIFSRHEIEICNYYESITTKGLGEEVVPSAMTRMSYLNEHNESIAADHHGMVKYPSETDGTYVSIMKKIRRMAPENSRTTQAASGPKLDRSVLARVSQLPAGIDKQGLRSLLSQSDKDLGAAENIVVLSIAPSPDLWVDPAKNLTAIISFKKTPAFLREQNMKLVLLTEVGNVIVENSFAGFTALNNVASGEHVADCVAISGLGAHPIKSWESAGPITDFMWLRDGLAKRTEGIRILSYGYDPYLHLNHPPDVIDNATKSLISHLKAIGRLSSSAKPLLFIVHSLGGIVLKRAILELSNCEGEERCMIHNLRSIIFFAVPNRIAENHSMYSMVEDVRFKLVISNFLRSPSYLSDLDQRFSGISKLREIRVISIYETLPSQVDQVSIKGLTSGIKEDILVTKKMAIQPNSKEIDIMPIHQTHSGIIKLQEGSLDITVLVARVRDILGAPNRANESLSQASKTLSSSSGLFSIFSSASKWASRARRLTPWLRTHGRSAVSPMDMALVEEGSEHPSETSTDDHIKELLQSLDVVETRLRLEGVDNACPQTFGWIWTDPDVNFQSWLMNDQSLYWINGKPGSGKSTLMKYLWTHENTRASIKRSRGRPTISVSFFFHDRGSYMQKSFEGLLCSILHQILDSESRCAELVLPSYAERTQEETQHWTLSDLTRMFRQILSQSDFPLTIYFFLDALDEHDGPPQAIADFIRSVATPPQESLTKTKMCFSSRPWEVFLENFVESPGFRMQNQTQEDIEVYVDGRLYDLSITKMATSSGDTEVVQKVTQFKTDLIHKAEGTFVWLRMVLDDLSLRLSDELTSFEDLAATISTLPVDLENYYDRIVEQIPSNLRFESYAMIEVVLRGESGLSLYEFEAAVSCARHRTLEDCIRTISRNSFTAPDKSSCGQCRKHIQRTCGGLIDIEFEGVSERAKVQFMHQSVKDYVSQPGFGSKILGSSSSSPRENGYSFLAKSALASMTISFDKNRGSQVQRNDVSEDNFHELVQWKLINQAEDTTGVSLKRFVDAMPSKACECLLLKILETSNFAAREGIWKNPKLTFAVVTGLLLYVQETLQDCPEKVNDNGSSPLLYYATVFSHQWNPESKMVNLLLSFGANIHCTCDGYTPFQWVFGSVYFGLDPSSKFPSLQTIKAFMDYGQDPGMDIFVRHFTEKSNRKIRCRALHVVPRNCIKALLEAQADVNALSETGLTPLDVRLERKWRVSCMKYRNAFNAVVLLLKHGACVTHTGKKAYEAFCHDMRENGLDTSVLPKTPPLLPLGFQRESLLRVTRFLR